MESLRSGQACLLEPDPALLGEAERIAEALRLRGLDAPAEQAIAVHLGDRSALEVAREFEISVDSVRRWVQQAERDQGRRQDGLSSPEREELVRLRRETRRLRMEREILSKAAAWFARETDSIT